MTRRSITSSDSFASRAQRSEAKRVVLWLIVLAGLAAITFARRWAGGIVMRDDEVFYPYQAIVLVAIACQIALLITLRRANRSGYLLPRWLFHAAAMFDIAVACALLIVVAYRSPRGPLAALTGPPLLLIPLVVLMSVLQLRPNITLRAGLTGAAVHLLLALRAISVTHSLPEAYPVYLTYSAVLALTAVIGMVVSREVKAHVVEEAEEAAAHERAQRHVREMERDLDVARSIQRGLLPARTPELAGFDISGMNRPAAQTGGDYYDFQPLPDGRLAVALADVSGHGIGPALVMAVCRAYARATAMTVPDPAALVTRLNQLLHTDLPSDRFITFVLAVLEESGGAHLISAGHGPTLLYRASTSEVTQFGGDGMPLGVSSIEEYGPTTSLALEEGDVLVMLTDGFFEWARPADGQPYGIPRLQEALRAAAHQDAAAILRFIDDAVCTFCSGSTQPDDMTAIVVKRIAPAASPM
jgi:serine phosphatase RsbU (regulator of sigma subunit)